MMNLDLLFTASKLTGDSKYKDIAVRHADHTMANHFRPDYTCWHVVSYNDDGTVELKQTFQGKNDDSSWARGQAWAVYGYTSCYREAARHGQSTAIPHATVRPEMRNILTSHAR